MGGDRREEPGSGIPLTVSAFNAGWKSTMKTNYRLGLMLIVSGALGAATVMTLNAQVKPPVICRHRHQRNVGRHGFYESSRSLATK
jgi:hypothetical protein